MTTRLHEERLNAVLAAIRASGATSVADLGCGDGDLFLRLAREDAHRRLVGMDPDAAALDRLRHRLARAGAGGAGADLRQASATEPPHDLQGIGCAVLVEVIEHIPPDRLSQLERAVFHNMRPGTVVVTTPNAEFNPLLGVPAHRFRHPDHRFEWTRQKFRDWTERIGRTAGYSIDVSDIAGCHPDLGGATQMAVFRARERDRSARSRISG